ncbi:MAG: S8 family serine peptidase [Gammaproteobacteria bacterium]|nr:S8 family serine peptidase [Gammaproteobacteria bacterium]
MKAVNTFAEKLRLVFILFSLIILSACESTPEPKGQTTTLEKISEISDGLMIKFDDNASGSFDTRATILNNFGLEEVSPISSLAPGWFLVRQKESLQDLQHVIDGVVSTQGILAVEPDYFIYSHRVLPDDTEFNKQYVLNNDGQTGGLVDVDINALEAWDIQKGGPVVVAILDTGIDIAHEDLARNIWENPTEVATNSIDDDGNGFADDIKGWNFLTNANSANDDNGHGTHIAGIIGADTNNNTGIAGINRNAKLIPLKVLNAQGIGKISNAIKALEYAIANGARLSNLSWGTKYYSEALYEACETAATKNHLIITSSGNDGVDLDDAPIYPAAYELNNVISVGASTQRAQLATFSNFSTSGKVHVAAPGVDILSTLTSNTQQADYPIGYGLMSGTSQAAAIVTGVVSLMLSQDDQITAWEIKQALFNSTDINSAFSTKIGSGGLVNAYGAVTQFAATGWVDDIVDDTNNTPATTPATTPTTTPTTTTGDQTPQIDILTLSPEDIRLSVNESIEFVLNGGTGPFTYELSNPNIGVINSSGIFTAKKNGKTQLIVTDANGVTSNASAILVTSLDITPKNFTFMLVNDASDLQITGGTGPYQWKITGDKNSVSIIVDETDTSRARIVSVQPGTFQVHAIDTAGNSVLAFSSNAISIIETLSINTVNNNSLWPGENLQLLASGGKTPYTWRVTNNSSSNISVDNTGLVSALTSGTATVEVVDIFNHVDSIQLNIKTVSLTTESITIEEGETVQLNANGFGKLTYIVTGLGTAAIDVSTNKLTATKAGDIVVTMTDEYGNKATTNITITAVPELTIDNKTTVNTEIWFGDFANTTSLSATGGKGAYTWSVFSGSAFASVDSEGLVTAKAPGNTTIQVSDTSGQIDTINITVKQVAITNTDTTITIDEHGGDYQFNGIGFGNLQWTSSRGNIDPSTGLFTTGSSGSVTITLTDDNGNTVKKTVEVKITD